VSAVAASNADLIVLNRSVSAAYRRINVLVCGTKKFNLQTKKRLMLGHERTVGGAGHDSTETL
jgi:hypothetical protein